MMFVKIVVIAFIVMMVIGIFYYIFRFVGGVAAIILGFLGTIGLAVVFIIKTASYPFRLPFILKKRKQEREELELETKRLAEMLDDPREYDDVYF